MKPPSIPTSPLRHVDDWDDDVRQRYSDAADSDFRNYTPETRPGVEEFYRLNHQHQTVDFVRSKRKEFLPLRRREMTIWQAMDFLNELVDDSDPDLELPQIAHAMQTAEAIRKDGHPDWFVVTGLIHDMGKVLCLFGEPQWAVVGDTFPVGCAWSDRIVYPEFFALNPDRNVSTYQSATGIYTPNGGLDQVLMSWGHDEYLYHVVRNHLPVEAQYMIRYHSFYAAHREQQYDWLMNDQDRRLFAWVRAFNRYDLYTKTDVAPDVDALKPFYEQLVEKFFPHPLWW